MPRATCLRACLLGLLTTALSLHPHSARAGAPQNSWKAGTASVVITPEQPMWMAGYASRDKPSEGKIHDLTASALALEDAQGTRLVIVTLDLIGISIQMREGLAKQVAQQYQLPSEGLLVNASHTHCGPVLKPVTKRAAPCDTRSSPGRLHRRSKRS